MSILLLDTNIISDMMRNLEGRAATRAREASVHRGTDALYTSIVVQCELEYGLARKPGARLLTAYRGVMQSIEVLPLDESVAAHGFGNFGQGVGGRLAHGLAPECGSKVHFYASVFDAVGRMLHV